MDINSVATRLLAFTARNGWKAIASETAQRYIGAAAGNLLEPVVDGDSLKRNCTRLYRVFTGLESRRYRQKAAALVEFVTAALVDLERQQGGAGDVVAIGLQQCAEAHTAALTNAAAPELVREVLEAIDSLIAYLPAGGPVVQVIRV